MINNKRYWALAVHPDLKERDIAKKVSKDVVVKAQAIVYELLRCENPTLHPKVESMRTLRGVWKIDVCWSYRLFFELVGPEQYEVKLEDGKGTLFLLGLLSHECYSRNLPINGRTGQLK